MVGFKTWLILRLIVAFREASRMVVLNQETTKLEAAMLQQSSKNAPVLRGNY